MGRDTQQQHPKADEHLFMYGRSLTLPQILSEAFLYVRQETYVLVRLTAEDGEAETFEKLGSLVDLGFFAGEQVEGGSLEGCYTSYNQ